MSWAGGATAWYARRERANAEDSDDDDLPSLFGEDEPLAPEEAAARQSPARPGSRATAAEAEDTPSREDTREDTFIISTALHEAVQTIFDPSNGLKKRAGQLLLNNTQGKFRLFDSLDLDEEKLDSAGSLSSELALGYDYEHFAASLERAACADRCGVHCSGECRVRAFVVREDGGADYFFGSLEDIHGSILTACGARRVYIYDEFEHTTMARLTKQLDVAIQEGAPGLVMRTTELKTVPGLVRAPLLPGPQHSPQGTHSVLWRARALLSAHLLSSVALVVCNSELTRQGCVCRRACLGAASL